MMQRGLELDGGINFRDLGGYATNRGTRVRWRKLFRSGHLNQLSDGDQLTLKALGITEVHDFRKAEEQQREPSRHWGVTPFNDYGMNIGSLGEFWDHLYQGQLTTDKAHQLVVDGYRSCLQDVAPHYRRLLLALHDNREHASLFHCAAGKDRTGLAAALILSLLEVPRGIIIEDYLLTQTHFDEQALIEKVEGHLRRSGVNEWERGWLIPFCSVHVDNLLGFFESVDSEFGSATGYLRHGLGLSDSFMEEFREAFTEA